MRRATKLQKNSNMDNLEELANRISENTDHTQIDDLSRQLMNNEEILNNKSNYPELNRIEQSHAQQMVDFSVSLARWNISREKNHKQIRVMLRKFNFLKKTSSGLSAVSAIFSFATNLFQKIYQPDSQLLLISNIVSASSLIYASIIHNYADRKCTDLKLNLKQDWFQIIEILRQRKNMNFLSLDLQSFFPSGIDLKSIHDDILHELNWQEIMISSLIKSHLKTKDYITEENLVAIRVFVSSKIVRFWIYR